ncbi:MAG: flavodoxin [Actinobacteria bacterium]|nr:flavodoxin [Actinomycetota bacterium]
MKALVVYESFWGNTAAVARAIAEGLGPEARAVVTSDATPALVADADLVVVGAPVLGFRLPTEEMRESIGKGMSGSSAPDLSHPSLRSWLAGLSRHGGRYAAFETRVRMSPGGATPAIGKEMERAGFRAVAKARRFIVTGKYGPLRRGELELAKQWGAELARAME